MASLKILHTADWHFGASFASIPELRDLRQSHLAQSFTRMAQLAKSEAVDAVLIAGDLFDSPYPPKETERFVWNTLAALTPIRVYIAAGNHDYLAPDSALLSKDIPENVSLFGTEEEPFSLSEGSVLLHGRSFTKQYESHLWQTNADTDHLHIFVIHGDLSASEDYNPITLPEIRQSGMDYIALGHTHYYDGVKREGRTYYAYPGSPEGHGFDECGEKGVLLGTVSSTGTDLQFYPLSSHEYRDIELDISHAAHPEDIRKAISAVLEPSHLYKIRLVGAVSPSLLIQPQTLAELCQVEALYIKIKNETSQDIDIDAYIKAGGLTGKFLSYIKASDASDAVKSLAIRYGLTALENKEVKWD